VAPPKRIFFATDVHGSEACFFKFLNAWKPYKADIMILGGDLSGKALAPIVDRGDGFFESSFLGIEQVQPLKDVAGFEDRVRRTGLYPLRMDKETYAELSEDKTKLESLFERLIRERIEGWVSLAEEKLRGAKAEFYISGGNDDPLFVDDLLRKSHVFTDSEKEVVTLSGGNEMITLSWVNPTPWRTPREMEEGKLEKMINELASNLRSTNSSIFNLHAPPRDSGLDQVQKLDDELKPVFEGGQPVMVSAGSNAVARVIELFKPMLGFHGHIHESRGAAKIGRTLCINPGSEYSETILRGVVVDVEDGHVKSHIFTSG